MKLEGGQCKTKRDEVGTGQDYNHQQMRLGLEWPDWCAIYTECRECVVRKRRTKHNWCLSWVIRLEGSSNKHSLNIHPPKPTTFGLRYLMFQWACPQLHLKSLEDARLHSKRLKLSLRQLLPKEISYMCANLSFCRLWSFILLSPLFL